MPETTPIEATVVPTPEHERPDLRVVIDATPDDEGEHEVALFACPTAERAEVSARRMCIRNGITFLLPGTRREKAGKNLMVALAEWYRVRQTYAADSALVMSASCTVEAAYANVLALTTDAGVKTPAERPA